MAASTEWVVQYGVSEWALNAPSVLTAARYFDAEEMTQHLEWADVLVSQASPGNAFGALNHAAWPMLLGRTKALGEHVDDHQVKFARKLEEMGKATDLADAGNLYGALVREQATSSQDRAQRIAAALQSSAMNELRFRRDVWRIVERFL
jgi:UDP-N-acetylglucosamine transferase subunit ALG13